MLVRRRWACPIIGSGDRRAHAFLKGQAKALQEQGEISVVRMCASCRYFRSYHRARLMENG